MTSGDIPQFGIKLAKYKDRPCAYAVVFNEEGRLLVLTVGKVIYNRDVTYHLPGGGIDSSEDPEVAVIREAMEEAGCEITDLEYIGKASEYFTETSTTGSVNKLGIFYKARMATIDPTKKVEADHEVCWLTPEEFLNSASGEFQKWAVKKVLN
ncbi:MAG: NUDIX domain-containing protein [bacterium]|nr:NUDIX domain-containing protein [bacterium]